MKRIFIRNVVKRARNTIPTTAALAAATVAIVIASTTTATFSSSTDYHATGVGGITLLLQQSVDLGGLDFLWEMRCCRKRWYTVKVMNTYIYKMDIFQNERRTICSCTPVHLKALSLRTLVFRINNNDSLQWYNGAPHWVKNNKIAIVWSTWSLLGCIERFVNYENNYSTPLALSRGPHL